MECNHGWLDTGFNTEFSGGDNDNGNDNDNENVNALPLDDGKDEAYDVAADLSQLESDAKLDLDLRSPSAPSAAQSEFGIGNESGLGVGNADAGAAVAGVEMLDSPPQAMNLASQLGDGKLNLSLCESFRLCLVFVDYRFC